MKSKKTKYGKTMAGFFRGQGTTVQPSEYYQQLVKNGYDVKQTKKGVIVTKVN